MAIPASFDSATGALTGDNLDNTIASGRDAARPTPSLRDDPDAGGQIQSAVHQPIPSLRSDPDSGGQIQSAVHQPIPSLRSDPDAGGHIQSAVQRPTPSLRDDPDAGGQIQSAMDRPTPSLRGDPDDGGRIHSAMQRPTPSLRGDPDDGGRDPKCRAAVCGWPAPVHCVRHGRRERSAAHARRNLPARAGHGVIFRRGRR